MQPLESNLPVARETHRAAPQVIEADYELSAGVLPLSHYLWLLRRHGWKVVGFVVVSLLATAIVSLRITPIYESTVTIDIDRKMPTGVLGHEATEAINNDADQFLATQVKLIQSDSVLRPVVDKYNLRGVEQDALEPAVDASEMSTQAPVILKRLRVTRPANTYIIQISYRSSNRQLAADVANSIAQSYLQHSYTIRYKATASLSDFMERQIEELKAKMEKSSEALLRFERELNVINPDEKTNIISARLLQLNAEYTTAQGDRIRKEAAYQAVKGNSLAAAQMSGQGEALKKLGESLNEAREKFAEVKNHYGINHPEFKKAQARLQEIVAQIEDSRSNVAQRVEEAYNESVNREGLLEQAVKETKGEFDTLNSRSFEYQTLKREAEGDKELYEELVRKIKEAGINASFQNGSIRVADAARPGLKPVFPRTGLNLLAAFLFATFLAAGAVVLSDVLDNTIRDPEQVTRLMQTDVIGSLPAVKDWRSRLSPVQFFGDGNERASDGYGDRPVPASALVEKKHDQALANYEEAIRALRHSILLADFDRRLKSVLLTSASPSEGKSTVAAHLAVAHAGQKRRTLLIDGDLRRPSAHRLFRVPNSIGLSNVLLQQISWRDAVIRMDHPQDLDILPAGPSTRRASDLIGMGLAQLLEEATREYDLVVLDAPPLLGFAEPLQMATAVDGVIVVARAGETSRTALGTVVTTLLRLRANLMGIVLNEVHRDVSAGYYYYGHYSKYYEGRNVGQDPVPLTKAAAK